MPPPGSAPTPTTRPACPISISDSGTSSGAALDDEDAFGGRGRERQPLPARPNEHLAGRPLVDFDLRAGRQADQRQAGQRARAARPRRERPGRCGGAASAADQCPRPDRGISPVARRDRVAVGVELRVAQFPVQLVQLLGGGQVLAAHRLVVQGGERQALLVCQVALPEAVRADQLEGPPLAFGGDAQGGIARLALILDRDPLAPPQLARDDRVAARLEVGRRGSARARGPSCPPCPRW